MPLLNPNPKGRLLQSQMTFLLNKFIEIEFTAEDALLLMNKMFGKSDISTLTVGEATKLVDALNTVGMFRKVGLRTFSPQRENGAIARQSMSAA